MSSVVGPIVVVVAVLIANFVLFSNDNNRKTKLARVAELRARTEHVEVPPQTRDILNGILDLLEGEL